MPKCTIDGREVEFSPGENLVNVAKRVGLDIPVFCYHPGLSVVAQCRMCLVEVEKMPKLQTACSTPATDGMVVKTQSAAVKKARESTMEFLLVNHPLDCPICDKAGECDLQDNSFAHGSPTMRSTEERRTYVDVDMGPVIQKNMNRCIHCTRCIRFGDEVAGIHEMVAVQRGNYTDITTIDGMPLKSEYSGNYADICPTGALTLKDFRFKKRSWFLKKVPSVCDGCSRGCNLELHHEAGQIHRALPRTNMAINKYWLCDEGRMRFRDLQSADRILQPKVSGEKTDWASAIAFANKEAANAKSVLILLGADLTNEEISAVQTFSKEMFSTRANLRSVATVSGYETVSTSGQDGPADKILKMKAKVPNLKGLEMAGVEPYRDSDAADCVILFSGGRVQAPALKGAKKIFVGVFPNTEKQIQGAVVLPGLGFTEKDGTFINFQGAAQKIKKAVPNPGQSKAISEILMLWMNESKRNATATSGMGANP